MGPVQSATAIRCDTGWFPHSLSLAAELSADGWCGVLRTPHHRVALTDIHSVWYRSPTAFQFVDWLTPAERGHADREAKLGLGGVLASLPALWVNHPSHEADAGYKARQLATAQACGLTVPRTLITNDPDMVRDFARGCDRVVTKVLGANIIGDKADRKIAYTHLLDDSDLSDLRGVAGTAHLFQEWGWRQETRGPRSHRRTTVLRSSHPRRQRNGSNRLARGLRLLDIHSN